MNRIVEPTPTADCTCGHPVSHHDAGECWTTPDGRESRSVVCGCYSYVEVPA